MFNKLIFLYVFLLTAMLPAHAFDQSHKTAAGITGGIVVPFGSNKFNEQADGFWAYGAYLRHHFDSNWGIDVAGTRQDYDKICTCTRSNIFDVLGFYRLKGPEDLSPILGLGLGAVDNSAHQNLHLGMRARIGMEKAYSETLAIGAHIDYQGVTKMPGANKGPSPSDISTFTPKLELTWYFGNK